METVFASEKYTEGELFLFLLETPSLCLIADNESKDFLSLVANFENI